MKMQPLRCFFLTSFPGLFFAFTIIHGNGRPAKKWGRPESIYHVSGREVDVRREGLIFKYICTKLESEFLTGQDE